MKEVKKRKQADFGAPESLKAKLTDKAESIIKNCLDRGCESLGIVRDKEGRAVLCCTQGDRVVMCTADRTRACEPVNTGSPYTGAQIMRTKISGGKLATAMPRDRNR